jgi:ribosomal protein L11 methyltransferase
VRGNALQESMQVSLAPLETLAGPYDIVVANIVHDVLVGMADELMRMLADNGTLILSGILAGKQVANIKSVFTGKGLRLSGEKTRQEWAALRFSKELV